MRERECAENQRAENQCAENQSIFNRLCDDLVVTVIVSLPANSLKKYIFVIINGAGL